MASGNTASKTLFKMAMEGMWSEVEKEYDKEESYTAKITISGDTALHVAAASGLDDVVRKLIAAITKIEVGSSERLKKALNIKNKEGNTPLHIVASLGNVSMCENLLLSGDEPEILKDLVKIENNDGETPLFTAVQMGNKDAFLCLLFICGIRNSLECCTRNDGDNILHCAIAYEYFDLAYQIIHLYEDLVERVNTDGDTPIKILASKPSAFRSGSKLGILDTIIYNCIFVNELKRATSYVKITNTNQEKHSVWIKYCICFLRKCFQQSVNKKEQMHGSSQADLEKQKAPHTARETACVQGLNSVDCKNRFKYVLKLITHTAIMVVYRIGRCARIRRLIEEKEKHTWSKKVLNELLNRSNTYAYDRGGLYKDESGEEAMRHFDFETAPPVHLSSIEKKNTPKDPAILIATRHGIIEIIEEILHYFPVAVHDLDANKKNIVLLAVETRQLEVYNLLLEKHSSSDLVHVHVNDNAFRKVDSDGNSALHLAAKLKDNQEPWSIPGGALQMQWEIKWNKFVKNSMPPNFFTRYNKHGKTPEEIFTESHKELVQKGGEWLKSTAESCSVVAALIATVAFATSTTVPGGTEQNGKPTLEDQFAFKMFAITSLIALCFSVTSLSMFLSILTSRYRENDFGKSLPLKLLLGLTSLFVSIASILISFCSGHFFVLGETLRYAAFPVYAVTCLPISFFAAAQFPLYFDLIRATFKSPFSKSSRAKAAKNSMKREEKYFQLEDL